MCVHPSNINTLSLTSLQLNLDYYKKWQEDGEDWQIEVDMIETEMKRRAEAGEMVDVE